MGSAGGNIHEAATVEKSLILPQKVKRRINQHMTQQFHSYAYTQKN